MTIECAILGMLNREAMAGYDVKKRIQDSVIMPWSGNNNQVYKALSALLNEGFVDSELHHQDGLPSRKVYTITQSGKDMLKEWLTAPPEAMELRKPFLMQLNFAGMLGARKADALLSEYERQLYAQINRQVARSGDAESKGFESVLAALVDENIAANYQTELDWTKRAREAISGYVETERKETEGAKENGVNADMHYEVVEKNGVSYLKYLPSEVRPEAIEATQVIGDCIGERANRVMLYERALPEGFFSLRTGMAGELMQKLGQYRVKAALVVDVRSVKGKFKDMLIETNRGSAFRSFETEEQAEEWLMGEV